MVSGRFRVAVVYGLGYVACFVCPALQVYMWVNDCNRWLCLFAIMMIICISTDDASTENISFTGCFVPSTFLGSSKVEVNR